MVFQTTNQSHMVWDVPVLAVPIHQFFFLPRKGRVLLGGRWWCQDLQLQPGDLGDFEIGGGTPPIVII